MRLSLAGLAVLAVLAAPAAFAQPAVPETAAPAGPAVAQPATGTKVIEAKQYGGKQSVFQADVKQMGQCCGGGIVTLIEVGTGWAPPSFAQPILCNTYAFVCSPCYDFKGD